MAQPGLVPQAERCTAGSLIPETAGLPSQRLLLTTGEAARRLGVSRQTIVSMCDAGDIPFTQVGTHRRIDPDVVEALRDRGRRKPTAARRSLWLAYAAAGVLVQDPDGALVTARDSLRSMLAASPRGMSRRWLARWEQLLDGPVDPVLEALTGTTVEHDELRQHSPLTAVLSDQQRQSVLEAFAARRETSPARGRSARLPA
jgi:excisionase family DNA binding protein